MARGRAKARMPIYSHPFHSDASADVTLTNQALAESFIPAANRRLVNKIDLTDYTEVRLVGNVGVLSAVVGSQVNLQYHTSFSTTVSDYSPIGTSAVAISLEATGATATAWVPLVAAARADVFITLVSVGGDGAADPAIASMHAQFR